MKTVFLKKYHTLYLLYIGISIIGIGRYEKFHIGILSVSADKKIEFNGIGRYEKKLICRTLLGFISEML